MKKILVTLMAIIFSTTTFASGEDDPLIYKVMIEKLEIRNTDTHNPLVLDTSAWIGKDLSKFWVKTEIERVDSETEEAELQFLYSRAVTPFWDFQIGWRRDIKPEPTRDYLALGFTGLSPYFIETDFSVFMGESGQINARLDAEYEYMFTQKLILSPEIEMNIYSKDDEEIGVGSGLSDMEVGVRLQYEMLREFALYMGVNWTEKFGETANLAEEEDEESSDTQLVAGIRAWF